MNNDIYKIPLCFEYPEFECESGWDEIILSTLMCIDRHLRNKKQSRNFESDDFEVYTADFKVEQIKQKSGGLKIICNFTDEHISGIISLAEVMAYRTCEISGEPGFMHRKGSTSKTLSPTIATKNGFEPSGKDHRKVILENEHKRQ